MSICHEAFFSEDMIKDLLELLKEEQDVPDINVGKWIPCSKRLPEEENKYLCTCSSDDKMFVLSFHKNLYAYDRYVFEQYKGTVHPGFIIYDSIYGDTEVDVLAWMPLPEPYKEVDE